ncbi:MAG: gliding motility protein GldM [Bacteroidota bacterium]
MAGGKETPRQKMIGMMYLVLTALLALQVSNAVLEKFIFMNDALETMAADYEEKNNATVAGMESEVAKRNNLPEEVAVLDVAKEVKKRTGEVMENLRELKETMIEITGGRVEETGELVGAKDYDKVSTMMIQQERGKELEKMLNDYAKFLIQKTGTKEPEKFAPLARDAKDIPVFANNPNNKEKRFVELYFENTPTAAGMATISYMETEVMDYERMALKELADSIHAAEVAFSSIFPLIRPESKIVAAGGKYVAEMFIAASSPALTPKFYMDGNELPVEELDLGDGVKIKKGKVEFTAKGGNYDPKTQLSRRTFNAKIDLEGKPYESPIEYFVAKPTIMVASAALSALWKNCGNALNVQVPSLGNAYNPNITTTNASVVRGGGKGEVTIIPKTRGKVVMTVRSSGTLIGTKTFTVKNIPKPSYDLKIPSSAGNIVDGVKAKAFRSINIVAVAEPSFAQDVPKDARYRVREVEVKLIRNGDPRKRQVFKSGKISLSSFAAEARKGDLYVFTIKQAVRVNFQNKSERVPTKNEIYKVLVSQ